MAKKIAGTTKTKITKLFKQGQSIKDIKAAVIGEFPKITPSRIRTVIRSHLFGLCDDLWSEAVKLRDSNKCIISKKGTGLNSHHLIGRSNLNYRWTLLNGVTLAADYHTLGGNIAAHGSTDVTQRFAEWMAEHRIAQWAWFERRMDDKSPLKVDIFILLDIATSLREKIELLSQPKPDILARKMIDRTKTPTGEQEAG